MHETNVLLYALIYLSAMVLVVPFAKRLGFGVVLGYLVAGVVIGPSVLGLTSDNASINSLAELGVVLMLFTIGLELDASRLWAMRHRVFTLGALQMAVCGGGFFVSTLGLGLPSTLALIIGLTLALSSTAVAVQLMNDRNYMGTQAGQSAFGVLLFQDMAAIPLLIVIGLIAPNAAADAHAFNAWYALGAIVLVTVMGLYGVRFALRWIAQNGSRELFVGAALLLVMAIMELMIWVGLSPGLGAFLAGVLLASSEYRHELEADLEPFKGLFLGLFFITIGAGINLSLLVANWPLVLGLLAAYLVLKFVLLFIVGTIARINMRERFIFAMLLTQGSEFAFVVGNLAASGGLLNREQSEWLNLIVALSLAASPLLMKAFDALLARSFSQNSDEPAMDTEMEQTPVIIAGFGRVGQIVGRLLLTSGVPVTVLDHDSSHIESIGRFGYKVYYGDAARMDLLEVAGIAKAKILVVAVDDVETSLEIIENVQKHYPNLTIVARASDVRHYYELRRLGVTLIERETFESSLKMGRMCLEKLGLSRYEAREAADHFRHYNVRNLLELEQHRDKENFTTIARELRETLEKQLSAHIQAPKGVADWQRTQEQRLSEGTD